MSGEGQQQKTKKKDSPQRLRDGKLRTDITKKAEKLKEDIDRIIEEIDEVLEENAEEFVKNYVQRGGQ